MLLLRLLCVAGLVLASQGQRHLDSMPASDVNQNQRNDYCFYGGPSQELNFNAGAWLNIFVDMPFRCAGIIYGYQFYAQTQGNLYVGVWRPTRGGTHARLIAKDVIPVTSTGSMRAIVEEDSQLPFQIGDLIGLHTDQSANEHNGGVVPYEDLRNAEAAGGLCCGLREQDLGRFHNSPHRDNDLEVGTELELTIYDILRIPAIQPITRGSHTRPPTAIPPPPTSGPPPPGGACGNPAITPTLADRIVGGFPAVPHSWPWMVALRWSDGNTFCGGSLVDRQWVVTASHCTPAWGDTQAARVRAARITIGAQFMNQATPYDRTLRVSQIIDHDGGDISLIKLAQPVTFSRQVSPVCIPSSGYGLPNGYDCYTTGWGMTSSRGSNTLLQVRVPIIDTETCTSPGWYPGQITYTMVCAGYAEGGRDSCQGDSGGPLVCHVRGVWQLIGVVSWGSGCAVAKSPGVYTKVSVFTDWIHHIIARN